MEPRRITDLPTNAADLATYGDVLLADACCSAAWADWRAGRMSLAEVFIWQEIHRMTLRGYLRLIVGGTTNDTHRGAFDRAHAGGAGGAADGSRGVDRPALVEECAHK